jgi:CelD/BcsL family acetyltransferase involved in cellulose biosynthesis
MPARILGLRQLTAADLGRWRALAAVAVEPNVFFEPEFVLAAQAGLETTGLGILVARDGERWIGCMPVRRTAHWRRLPLAALASWQHPYSFLSTPLIAADAVAPAVGSLIDQGRCAGTGLVVFERVGADGPVWATLDGALRERGAAAFGFQRMERASLVRRPEATYLDGMRPHRRRELNRLGRGLERELDGSLVVRDRAQDPDAYEDFLRLEASGWKGRDGTALACRGGHAAFFRAICAAYAREGRLQLLELSVGDRVVAMKCNLIAGGVVFCFKISYDETYAAYSPGLQLERQTIEVFHTQTEALSMDSCADPENDMINRLWPDRRSISTMVSSATGPFGRPSLELARVATKVHSRSQRH